MNCQSKMMLEPYDKYLDQREKNGNPIQVGLVGAGNLARMAITQLKNPHPKGIRLAALANRTPSNAKRLLDDLGIESVETDKIDPLISDSTRGPVVFSGDPGILSRTEGIDVILDTTGSVDFSLDIALQAFDAGKHLVLANAELDSLLGPALRKLADKAGVVYTNIDGDEPGVALNLIRYLSSINLKPVATGNLKGFIDPYRNPDTQAEFAKTHDQNPAIVTSFADGTKLCMEAAIIANATGFKVAQPGMIGPECNHVNEIASLLPAEQMLKHGLVDYALGAAPYTGAFVVVHETNPERMRYLEYLKMGQGPFYVFYTPYHLPHIQMMATIGRAAAGQDATVASMTTPTCEVICRAKKDLDAGEKLDGPGGFACYGVIENWQKANCPDRGLPISLCSGCKLKRSIRKDETIHISDVITPIESKAFEMWKCLSTI